ncbi:MAG: DUF2867 domain-containing protein [Blastocatellia bacterium]
MKEETFGQLPLRAHGLLAEVPLHMLERIDLPGGRADMSLAEISAITGFNGEVEMEVGPLTEALFWLRTLIGRVLGWDDAPALVETVSWRSRLTPEDRACSRIAPGTAAGISRIMYQFDNEMLGEIVNRTVHCFWLMATARTTTGYTLWFAVYVRKLNWFTPVYMALISPLLKRVIYPAMLRGVRARWARAFAGEGAAPGSMDRDLRQRVLKQ